jgi:V8-like Glu-specific endopeptidase
MWEPADIEKAVAEHPEVASAALKALGLELNLTMPDMAVFRSLETDMVTAEGLLVDWLSRQEALESFARALSSRGLAIDLNPPRIGASSIPNEQLAKFAREANAFGCRIRKGDKIVGSGVLVGPNTVLTAWHVIAPNGPPQLAPAIEVILSDDKRIRARPPAAYESQCSARERANLFPASDAEVQDLHDVAVLRLERPAGALLGTAKLPDTPASYVRNGAILVVHYPKGRKVGVGTGSLNKIRNLTARWSHTVEDTREGSSGGGCFDATLTLLGIHQGKDPRGQGRLVPASCFYNQLRDIVVNDQAPPRMWSLDGTPEGEFVIGRQAFFEAFSTVRRYPRVRGIRIKRANAAGGLSGLPFTYEILEQLVARRTDLRLMRLSFEALVDDVANEIARRATEAGIEVKPIPPKAGVADGQSAPEGVGADRGRRVAALIDAKAAELGIEVWIFIDHPAIAFGDAPRSTLEAFVDASIRHDHIRLAIAGFEAVALPGEDFYGPPEPPDMGVRGLINEILAGFRPSDVRLFLTDAAAAAGKTVSDERLDELVEESLDELPNINGVYEPWSAADVAKRLRKPVSKWFGKKK